VTVKAIRAGKINLTGTYIVNNRGILNLINLSINDSLGKSWNKTIPVLLNPKERDEIIGRLTEKGVSCVPLRFKTVGRWIKVDIAIVRGKKNYDKRETIKKRDLDRETRRGEL
jgi:SsrA-binding protein